MLDWEGHVRRRLARLELDTDERNEIVEELASHLHEYYDELRSQGMADEEATRQTLAQVSNWRNLRRTIQAVRIKENFMTNRVKQFWLPSLVTLVLSMGLLMLVQFFGPSPWVIARKSAWSLIAPVAVVYLPWLFSLPVIGAIGGYLSNRAGGSRRAMLSSTVFPVLPYFVFFLVALPVTAIFNDRLRDNIMFLALFVGLLAWVVAPGAALLTGGVLGELFLSRRVDSRRIAGS